MALAPAHIGRVSRIRYTFPVVRKRSLTAVLRHMPLRVTEALHRATHAAAKREGVSASQYVRDAVLYRLAYEAGERGDHEEMRRLVRDLVEAEREEKGQ